MKLVWILLLVAACDIPPVVPREPCDCAPSITCDSLYVRGWQEGINWQKAEDNRYIEQAWDEGYAAGLERWLELQEANSDGE